jgi:hypothetical protein
VESGEAKTTDARRRGRAEGARDWGGGGTSGLRGGGNARSRTISLWARRILGGGATRGWPAGGFREAATPWLDRSGSGRKWRTGDDGSVRTEGDGGD